MPSSVSWWIEAAKHGEGYFYIQVRAEQDRLRNSQLPLSIQQLFAAQLQAEADELLAGIDESKQGEDQDG